MRTFNVSPDKEKALGQRMSGLGVMESDLEESFIRSSGPGGQKVNKTATCVFIRHLPTGISVKCQRERSQSLNRFLARRLLLDKIERLQRGIINGERERIEKLRRQKRRRSKRAQEKVLAAKHQLAEKKRLRSRIAGEDAEG